MWYSASEARTRRMARPPTGARAAAVLPYVILAACACAGSFVQAGSDAEHVGDAAATERDGGAPADSAAGAAAAARAARARSLAAALRRQLMADNYDYGSSRSEELPPLPARPSYRAAPARAPRPSLLPFVNDIYISPAPRLTPAPAPAPAALRQPRAGYVLQKNDLLYYLDDDHLTRRVGNGPDGSHAQPAEVDLFTPDDTAEPTRQDSRAGEPASSLTAEEPSTGDKPPVEDESPAADELPADDAGADTTRKVKYKLLKVKVPGASVRRAGDGGGGYRRFLEEDGVTGVAIVNLGTGDEPFPEFRLPREGEERGEGEPNLEVALPSEEDAQGIPSPD